MENFSPDLKIFIPVLFWFYMAGKFFGCLKKKYFLLPHTAELCLYWNPYLRIPFWPSKFSTFCSLSHWNLVLAVTVLLLLVLLLAKSTITSSLVSEPMFTYEKVLMRTCKLFSTPGWSFSSAFENRAENSSPGLKILLCNTKIKNSWFLRYHGMKFQPWYVIKISAQGLNLSCNEPLKVE